MESGKRPTLIGPSSTKGRVTPKAIPWRNGLSRVGDKYAEYFAYLLRRTRIGLWYRFYWLYPLLIRHLAGRILDVGCGIGDFLRFHDSAIGIDINPYAVSYCRTLGLNAFLVTGNRIPFPSQTFDSALMDNVLEHLSDPTPLLLEVHRVLRPAGRLLVGVPGKKGFHADPDHKRYYDEASLIATVAPLGFSHERTFYTPFSLGALGDRLRFYCLYALFRVNEQPTHTPHHHANNSNTLTPRNQTHAHNNQPDSDHLNHC